MKQNILVMAKIQIHDHLLALFDSLSPDLHESVVYVDTTREMWVVLEEYFLQGNAPRSCAEIETQSYHYLPRQYDGGVIYIIPK